MKNLRHSTRTVLSGTLNTTHVAFSNGILVFGENLANPKGKRIYRHQLLYCISDEKIKKGDWCFNANKGIAVKYTKGVLSESAKKIISTTDAELINDGVKQMADKDVKYFVRHYTSPAASNEQKTLENKAVEKIAPAPKKPVPTSTKKPVDLASQPAKRRVGRPKKERIETESVEKRKVGRPRKHEDMTMVEFRRLEKKRISLEANEPMAGDRIQSQAQQALENFEKLPSNKGNELPIDARKSNIRIENVSDFVKYLDEKKLAKLATKYDFLNQGEYLIFVKGVISQIARDYHTKNMMPVEMVKKMIDDAYDAGIESTNTRHTFRREELYGKIMQVRG